MTTETEEAIAVTVSIPKQLYNRLQQQAIQKQHSLEDELLEIAANIKLTASNGSEKTPEKESISAELRTEISAMANFSDKALWKAARSRLPAKEANRIRDLNYKHQKVGYLSTEEIQEQAELMHHYDRSMLVRAHATVLLKQRGHDVEVLVK